LQRYGSLSIYKMWRPSAILDSFDAYWDHPPTMLVRFYCCAKLRLNRYNSLHNMKVSAFFAFALKMSIHVPKIILGIVLPKWRISSLPTHKKYLVAQKLIWRGPMHRWSLNDTFCCIYRAVESPSVFNGLEKKQNWHALSHGGSRARVIHGSLRPLSVHAKQHLGRFSCLVGLTVVSISNGTDAVAVSHR